MSTTKSVKLLCPTLPSYISVQAPWNTATTDKVSLPQIDIADLSDEELSAIADEWKAALLKHAEDRRKLRERKEVRNG